MSLRICCSEDCIERNIQVNATLCLHVLYFTVILLSSPWYLTVIYNVLKRMLIMMMHFPAACRKQLLFIIIYCRHNTRFLLLNLFQATICNRHISFHETATSDWQFYAFQYCCVLILIQAAEYLIFMYLKLLCFVIWYCIFYYF